MVSESIARQAVQIARASSAAQVLLGPMAAAFAKLGSGGTHSLTSWTCLWEDNFSSSAREPTRWGKMD